LQFQKNLTIRSAGQVVAKELDTIGQLQKINRDANELLDLLMRWNRGDEGALQILESQVRKIKVRGQEEEITDYKFKDPRELALSAMKEIRGQLKLQLEVFQALYDMQAVQQFQSEVLEIIGNVSPDARDEIIRRLTQANAIRSALDLNEQKFSRDDGKACGSLGSWALNTPIILDASLSHSTGTNI